MKRVKAYPETHFQGVISLENMLEFPVKGDLGIQVSEDGRVWICVNGTAFIRFSPHLNGFMSKEGMNEEALDQGVCVD
jgi:hypothetical protein